MTVKYGKFELPTSIKIEKVDEAGNFCRVIAEPLEASFGHTLGNALRRILLSSLEAPAIISLHLEGASHEYTAVDGIIEDVTRIVLNLKTALLRYLPTDTETGSRAVKIIRTTVDISHDQIEKAGGQYAVTMGELFKDSHFEVVNPDEPIFTVTKPMQKKVTLKVGHGRGYVPSEKLNITNKVAGEIPIDAIYSPVRLVNYFVEDCRVGGQTDMDRLVLEITTDGRITPQEALGFSTQIAAHHFSIFNQENFQAIMYEEEYDEAENATDSILNKLTLKISEIELSVRSTNCLAMANIDTIAELVVMPESEMLKFRNFGKKSLNEIKDKLEEMGLHLGMDLGRYAISQENVKEKIKEYMNK
ncbi:MAG: DNA-directed RNA polymerase subunit alpha [Chlamydiae bacterium RIFCSPHIGHO2_12_FULL_49_11]|nr:MAG: DNA-directed RNA polymerase subunit alpha [Chlamydiae bacterium RIFCSPHIGHO2_12_FULL_49_11]